MRIPSAIRWPLLCAGGFLLLSLGIFRGAGLAWSEAADGALAALAGTRPQTLSFADVEAIHPGVVLVLFAGGLVVRIFLIAYWAAYLVRRSSEMNEVKKLRKQLEGRMRPETAEMPPLPRTIRWN